MADYPERDIHTVKESCMYDICICNGDPRERHNVCKLDRYELEDRYFRLMEEVHSLKKLSNNQEDKIKRLATKLMRYGANPRNCIASIDITKDRERLSLLEAENAKLRNKMCLFRNQLANNKMFARSPPRGRRLGSTSGLITCRSEGSRLKAPSCQCINMRPGNDGNEVQKYSHKIQEMEKQKKEMLSRISELEAEVTTFSTGSCREKVAENVEYIRLWRKMKSCNEKLLNAQTTNDILNKQIYQLKCQLEEYTKSNIQMSEALETERMQVAQLDESMLKANDSEIISREKDEIIIDLRKELKILQEHNNELIQLSSTFSKVEKKNAEYKRKIAEQATENQVLQDKLSTEREDMHAVQAANEQLLSKIYDLQKHLDFLSIKNMIPPTNRSKKIHKQTSSNVLTLEEKMNMNLNNIKAKKQSQEDKKWKLEQYEKSTQAGDKSNLMSQTTQTEILANSAKDKISIDAIEKSDSNVTVHTRNGNSLSREGMIKLLDQVQINTPLESQNANRFKHSDSALLNSNITNQVSKLETKLFGDPSFKCNMIALPNMKDMLSFMNRFEELKSTNFNYDCD